MTHIFAFIKQFHNWYVTFPTNSGLKMTDFQDQRHGEKLCSLFITCSIEPYDMCTCLDKLHRELLYQLGTDLT